MWGVHPGRGAPKAQAAGQPPAGPLPRGASSIWTPLVLGRGGSHPAQGDFPCTSYKGELLLFAELFLCLLFLSQLEEASWHILPPFMV